MPTASPEPIPAGVTIRPGRSRDAAAIARFHVAVWRETYGTLAPATAIASLDETHRRAGWRDALADPARSTRIAVADGDIVGLVSAGPPADHVYGPRGEIKHLYVAAQARRLGLGAALLALGHKDVARAGFSGTGLGVVLENTAARAFYAATGGREVAQFTDPGPLWRSQMVLVAWD
ncbi:MAG: GNAT family N-acetyltransferase [Rhodobacter sp.]|nr:GNAT family N-acetyltransferase [Paracoccaceae bacterium]MCC0076042.1 GNAT family N-acetyltransferase [Rhodobacter sp.]